MRKQLAVVVAVAALLVGIPAAFAVAQEPAFDAATAPSLLPAGASLGTVSGVAGTTSRHSGTGPCTTESAPRGHPHAAVYRSAATVRSLLQLTVADDDAGTPSLCEVAVYRAPSGASSMDPFDSAQRSALAVATTRDCAAAASCSLRLWLGAGHTYFVAMWASPPDDADADAAPAESSFAYSARVRRVPALRVSVAGHRVRERCAGYHEVVAGRRFTLTARIAPALTGTVRFSWSAWDGDSWRLLRTYDRRLTDGRATLALTAASGGKRRAVARFVGNDVAIPATAAGVKMWHVTPKWTRFADGGLRLKVPYYRQQRRLSCEGATLRMAHNYFHPGRIDYDMSVYKITGIERRRPAVHGGCNPDRAFCGNVDGAMMVDGYGVHDAPIARAATVYDRCRPGVRLFRYSQTAIARHLADGYPVIVWGAHRGASGIYRRTWRAWDGHYVVAWSVEHVWTVVGFRGPVSSPTAFIIHNPSRATGAGNVTVSPSRFYAFTKYFKTAVVVRG